MPSQPPTVMMPAGEGSSNIGDIVTVVSWAPHLSQLLEPTAFTLNPLGGQPTKPPQSTRGRFPPQKANK